MKRIKKDMVTRKTVFQMLWVDFAAIFILLVGVLTAVYLGLSFQRSKQDYLEYNEMLLKSIESRLQSYFTDLDKSAKAIFANPVLWENVMGRGKVKRVDLAEQLRIICGNFYYSSHHITDVRLYFPGDGGLYSMNRDVLVNNKPFYRFYDQQGDNPGVDEALKAPGVYQYQMNQEGKLIVVTALSQPFGEQAAFVFQYTLSDSLWEALTEDLRTKEELVLIFNSNHKFSYCSDSEYQKYLPLIQAQVEEGEEGFLYMNLDERFLLEYHTWADSDWIVAKAIPVSRFYSSLETNVMIYGLCGLLVGTFLIGIFISITYRVSRPIGVLSKGLTAMTPEHFELDADYSKKDEIGILYQKCHENISMIQNLIKKEYQLNLSEKEARLKILQLQLNPHFIYNVLQLLSNIAVESGNKEIEEITDAFGLLLRYNLANENRKVKVVEEVRALEHYFFIVQKTYGKRLEISVELEKAVEQQEMLPFILQPIVENAFKHGLSRKIGQIQIQVQIYQAEDRLKLVIRDNGIGMGREEIEAIKGFHPEENISGDIIGGKGLALIQGRIELEYGQPYGIDAESLFNIGTTIIVTLPLEEAGGGLDSAGKERRRDDETDNGYF